jgi:hypothetical protein
MSLPRVRLQTPRPSDWPLLARALGIAVLGLLCVAAAVELKNWVGRLSHPLRFFPAPRHVELRPRLPRLQPEPLTPELRRKGFSECNPHDPVGLGPYRPMQNLCVGQIAIPQRGGHTADFGYDVVVHFHGQSPVRKTLAQVARGVVFVGVDKGLGSGSYSTPFQNPDLFPKLQQCIEGALRRTSGDPHAHVRHLALSAWSAGYGAVNEILKRYADRIDAVVLLDGLHAAWNPRHPRHDKSLHAVTAGPIQPTFDFARRALAGEKIFIFTHSRVDPIDYPSTTQTADLLLSELGLVRQPTPDDGSPFAQVAGVDQKGFHLWSVRGSDEMAHCAHIALVARAVRDVLEEAWQTPPMDRTVPRTPAPKLGGRAPDAGIVELEVVGDEAPPPPGPPAPADPEGPVPPAAAE